MIQFLKSKNGVKNNSSVVRNFDYDKNGTTLKFTLRIDIKEELNDFLEILKVAISDVEIEINK